ncbi:MAG: DUF6054 family protein [Oscillospiraceae bacterium]|jgi:hypothetical protein|nr:DUF6054 family protein [Oscillospiraceae bacterium]
MTKAEYRLEGDFDERLALLEAGMGDGATLVESSDFGEGGARCAVRVFARHSMVRGERTSLCITLFSAGGRALHLSAVAIGDSRAASLKISARSEKSFLEALNELLLGCTEAFADEEDETKQRRRGN